VVGCHRRHRVQEFVDKTKEELTALNEALVIDAIAKMEKADAAIFESRTWSSGDFIRSSHLIVHRFMIDFL
jgi:hypothetical protein